MSVLGPTLCCLAVYALAYRFYARFLSRRVFALRPEVPTPAHVLRDGIDYVPTRKAIVFGHHFASITGLAPMLGPAVAVIWGWVPAMIWVVMGAVTIGCVHDLSALVLSLRGRGMSIAQVAEGVVGSRVKTLFHLVIFFAVGLAMGVFVFVLGKLFSQRIDAQTSGYPGAVIPSAGLMILAMVIGFLLYRRHWRLGPLAMIAFVISLGLVYLGYRYPTLGFGDRWPGPSSWIYILLGYGFLASILPVWVLLQARDFINSLLLYLGLAAAYLGMVVIGPTFQAPAYRPEVPGAPGLIPFVFIIIACGAASGFHGLVSSGTTAKQLARETDAPAVGYGGMIAESLLGLLAVLATTAGFSSSDAWHARYHDWSSAQGLAGNLSAFIDGAAGFISGLGVGKELAGAFVAVVVVSFALTTLDSATRLLRYNIEEIGQTLKLQPLSNRFVSSGLAVAVIALFAFYEVDGKPAALALWTLFGTTNQLLAGLTLLVVTIYLKQRGKPVWFTGVPALLMLASTLVAMVTNLTGFFLGEPTKWLLAGVGFALLALGGWIGIETAIGWRTSERIESLDVSGL